MAGTGDPATGSRRARGRAGALAAGCLAAALLACAEPPRESPAPAAEAPPAVPPFQAALDRHGIPLALPQGKAILVNVPAFELIAFEDARPVLRSRVIVGTAADPTPLIDTVTSAVRFRPSWRPTPSMVASGEYRDRVWPPGRRNPLGLAAVRLEPGLLVYLHDTNRRDLFDREGRALSHGCIRVERWDALIAWLLGMDLATVRAHAEGRRSFDAPTPPVPVLIRYETRFPDAAGRLARFPDIYGLDGDRAPLPPARPEAHCAPI